MRIVRPYLMVAGFGLIAFTSFGLMNASPWLNLEFLGIPAGNMALYISLILLSVFSLINVTNNLFHKSIAVLTLLLAVSWYPTGIIWSGNAQLNFTNNGEHWLAFSYFVSALSLLMCVVAILIKIVKVASQNN